MSSLLYGKEIPNNKINDVADAISSLGISFFLPFSSRRKTERWIEEGKYECIAANYAAPKYIRNKTVHQSCFMAGYVAEFNKHHETNYLGDYDASKQT